MALITNQVRDAAEAKASPAQLELYATAEAGRKLRTIANQFNITNDEAYGIFAVTAGDVVLGLVRPEELGEVLLGRLPGLPQSTAVELADAINRFAAPVYAENSTKIISNPELQAEISSLENTVSHLEPVRTMSHDMQQYSSEEQAYTATGQSDILNRRDDTPRWETDTTE